MKEVKTETEKQNVEQALPTIPTPPQALVQTSVNYARNYTKDEDGLWEQVSLSTNKNVYQATNVNEVSNESWVTLKLTRTSDSDCSCKDTEIIIHEKTDVTY